MAPSACCARSAVPTTAPVIPTVGIGRESERRSYGRIGPPTRNRVDSTLSRECACRCSTRRRIGVEAKLVGEIAGAGRFASDAQLARAAGVAPILVSSGKTNRQRLDRGGNRQINATIHRIAITRCAATSRLQNYIDRKRFEGKSTRRCCGTGRLT